MLGRRLAGEAALVRLRRGAEYRRAGFDLCGSLTGGPSHCQFRITVRLEIPSAGALCVLPEAIWDTLSAE